VGEEVGVGSGELGETAFEGKEKGKKEELVSKRRTRGRSILKKLKGGLASLGGFLKRGTDVKLRVERKRNFKPALVVAVASIFLLVGSVAWGLWRRGWLAQEREEEQFLGRIRDKIEEGRSLAELNPIRAKQLLLEADQLAGELEDDESGGLVLGVKNEIEEVLRLVSREYQLGQLTPFFDLTIIKEGGRGVSLDRVGEELVVLDIASGVVYGVETQSKKGRIVAGGEDLRGAYELAVSDTGLFILTEEGVFQKEMGEKTAKKVVKSDRDWGKIIDFWTYGGNLYLLAGGASSLYRYPVIEAGFGVKQSWLKGEEINLQGAFSMAVDGSIWILKEEGALLKFTHGFSDPFGIGGLDKAFDRPQQIYTNVQEENLYVLDGGNNRVVVLGKDGEYRAQYLWTGSFSVEEILVSEEEGKIWLLGGSKIYEIKLR
jgi:hypothetical protein